MFLVHEHALMANTPHCLTNQWALPAGARQHCRLQSRCTNSEHVHSSVEKTRRKLLAGAALTVSLFRPRPAVAEPPAAVEQGTQPQPGTADVQGAPSNSSPQAGFQPEPVPSPAKPPPEAKLPSPSKPPNGQPQPQKSPSSAAEDLTIGEAKKLLEEEEERRKQRRRRKGRIRELEEVRAELAEKELVLLEREQEVLEKEQTVGTLREQLEIEKKLRTLLTKEKEKAEEEARLAMGMCTGGAMLP